MDREALWFTLQLYIYLNCGIDDLQCISFRCLKVKVLVAQLCPTLCNPMDGSLPGFSVHEILQARILE